MSKTLINEYKALVKTKVQIVTEMDTLPHGYISKKTIKNKQYYYLQNRVGGKQVGKYVKATEVDDVIMKIELYKQFKATLPKINVRMNQLEQAADLIDKNISRKLLILKLSGSMDEINMEQKDNSIAFASAMNAVEGIAISEQTKIDITQWRNGNKSFESIFQSTLKRYGCKSKM